MATENSSTKHAPTPWKSTQIRDGYEIHTTSLNGDGDYAAFAYSKEDSDFIVLRVNAHDELVAALRGCIDALAKMTAPESIGHAEMVAASAVLAKVQS